MGGPEIGTGGSTAPRNGYGERGHDHSGGDMGRAALLSVATLSLDPFSAFSSDWSTGIDTFVSVFMVGPSLTRTDGRVRLSIFVPPCDLEIGAYANLGWAAYVDVVQLLHIGDSATLNVKNITPGIGLGDSGEYPSASVAIPTPSSVGVKYLLAGSTEKIRMIPGQVNVLSLSATVTTDATTGSRKLDLKMVSLEFGVYAS